MDAIEQDRYDAIYGKMQIRCICNKVYYASRKPLAVCPDCGHKWNLSPAVEVAETVDHQARTATVSDQRRNNLLKGFQ